MRVDNGTAAEEIEAPPRIEGTRTAAARLLTDLTDDVGVVRTSVRMLHDRADELHHSVFEDMLKSRTAGRARSSVATLLSALADLGFAWRDIARLVGVSVPAVQKWRRNEGTSGENRARVARLLATCDLIQERCPIEEIASWFETPISTGAPLTPMDLYAGGRSDLVFDFASGHVSDPEQVLSQFDADWRERYRSDFEVFEAADGNLSIRPKAR